MTPILRMTTKSDWEKSLICKHTTNVRSKRVEKRVGALQKLADTLPAWDTEPAVDPCSSTLTRPIPLFSKNKNTATLCLYLPLTH